MSIETHPQPPATPPPATYTDHAYALLRPLIISAASGGGLLILGVLCLLAALLLTGQTSDARTLNTGLAGLLLTSNLVLAAGMIRSHLIQLRALLAAEQLADRRGTESSERLDDIEDQHDRLEHMMTRILRIQERQAQALTAFLDEQQRRAEDELGQRRGRRNG